MANSKIQKDQIDDVKRKLKEDIEFFNEHYLEVIAHKSVHEDLFDELGVFSNFYSLAVNYDKSFGEKYKAYAEERVKLREAYNELERKPAEIVAEIGKNMV